MIHLFRSFEKKRRGGDIQSPTTCGYNIKMKRAGNVQRRHYFYIKIKKKQTNKKTNKTKQKHYNALIKQTIL